MFSLVSVAQHRELYRWIQPVLVCEAIPGFVKELPFFPLVPPAV